MEISVTHNGNYKELHITDTSLKYNTGLLDTDEQVSIASDLIEVVWELLPSDYAMTKEMLSVIGQYL